MSRPVPLADELTKAYWNATREHRLVIQRCDACGHLQYPPEPICARCQSSGSSWADVAGRGVLYTFATIVRAFHPAFVEIVPVVVGLVELDEQEGLRMLTNVVGASPEDLRVGMALTLTWEDLDGGMALPQFTPVGAGVVKGLGRDVAVVGVGYSPVTRSGWPDPRALTLTACLDALADAGLHGGDVDAVFEYKFGPEAPNATYVQRMLGSPNLKAFGDIHGTGPSGLAGALAAIMAVASGACEVALTYRTMTREAGHTGGMAEDAPAVGGPDQFLTPYGYGGAIMPAIAMKKQRRLAELGGSVEDYGHVAINARRWAALNERAVLRSPITMDDYLSSRAVVDPLLLLDCDYPVNATVAVVITTAERARDLRAPVVHVDAMAFGTGRGDWLFSDDFLFGGTIACSEAMWARSSVGPADVDVAELYDGFTHIAISWVEALGLCGIGEFGEWVDGGRTIGPGGSMPLNTTGGQLAEGRLHGLGFLAEATQQLRGECGTRQVPDARVAVVANAHGPQCGSVVLTT